VKEGASLCASSRFTGPGICGADFPLKVAAIGEGARSALPTSRARQAPCRRASRFANYAPRPAYYDPPQQTYPQQSYPQAAPAVR
jgi:hypothetical protein